MIGGGLNRLMTEVPYIPLTFSIITTSDFGSVCLQVDAVLPKDSIYEIFVCLSKDKIKYQLT